MVTEKRIGRVHSHRVWLCTPRGREHSFGSDDIYFGTVDTATATVQNETGNLSYRKTQRGSVEVEGGWGRDRPAPHPQHAGG